MSNRNSIFLLSVCLSLAVPALFGCREKSDVADSIADVNLGVTGKKPAPIPTPEMLEQLGPKNDLNVEWFYPDTFYAIAGYPRKLFASPFGQGNESYFSGIISSFLQIPFDYSNVRRFVHTFAPPAQLPVEIEERGGKIVKQGLFARRVTVLTFENPTPREEWLAPFLSQAGVTADSLKRTIGSYEYYDLQVRSAGGFQKAFIHFPDDRTIVMIEGLEEDAQKLFRDRSVRNATIDRLERMNVDSKDLLMVASKEGVFVETEVIEQLLRDFFALPAQLASSGARNFRSMMLSVDLEAATGTPLAQVRYDALDEEGAREVGENIQGILVVAQTTLPTQDEATRKMLPVPYDFAIDALNACTVSIDGAEVSFVLEKFESFDKTATEEIRKIRKSVEEMQLQSQKAEQFSFLAQVFASHFQRFQTFPRTIRAADGTPLLSWRVSLLPTLGKADLYKQFNLNEPWDGPTNKPLIERIPKEFQSPDGNVPDGKTRICLFDTAGTLFGREKLELPDIKFPRSTLLFLLVAPSRAIEWTRPDELSFEPDQIESLTGPTLFGVTLLGQIVNIPIVPANDPRADFQKQLVEALVNGTPLPEAPAPEAPEVPVQENPPGETPALTSPPTETSPAAGLPAQDAATSNN